MESNRTRRLVALTVIILIILLVGFLFGRSCSSDDVSSDDRTTPAEQHQQDLENIRSILEPFMVGYSTQYDAAQSSTSELSAAKHRVQELTAEVTVLRATSQVATNERNTSQQRFLASQATVTELQQLLMSRQNEYGELYAKFNRINDRDDTAIVELTTAEELVVFYGVWDAWWSIVMDED